jgi:hypothetical protein
MNTPNEIVKRLDQFIAEGETDNVEVLLKTIIGISACLYSLAIWIARAEREERVQEDLLKYTKEQIVKEVILGKRGEKKTVAYADALAREETLELNEAFVKARYNARLLNLKRQSANVFVDSARSQISAAKREQEATREVT